WTPTLVVDPVQDRLLDIINMKKKALKKPSKSTTKVPASSPTPNKVVNIMDALRKSVAAENRTSK
ncbi:MAG: Ku78, Ku70 and Ku80 are 70kDa and 80kDa subunit of the Lupus Ku autoantigen, partial [Rhizobium sp.]|nr:Ku78, Ku70 and Ku80 are 70kDa and 80kDa subunit of the Lupus Ku autoantigen [Rhizobium sp.]